MALPLSLASEIARAAARNDAAQIAFLAGMKREFEAREDRIDELSELLGIKPGLPCLIHLQPDSKRIARILATRAGLVGRGVIYAAVYGGKPECDQPGPKIIDVQICRIRKAFASFASGFTDPAQRAVNTVTILTEHGCGWHIPAGQKPKARELLGLSLSLQQEFAS